MNDTKFTRRVVLKTGCVLAAGIAAPTVITSTALGRAAKAAASERVTVGHIGVGNRGRDLFGGDPRPGRRPDRRRGRLLRGPPRVDGHGLQGQRPIAISASCSPATTSTRW